MRRIKVALLAVVFAATFVTPIIGTGTTQAVAASGHKVTGVRVASSQTAKVKVSWNKSKGAVSYQVRVGSRTLKAKKTSLAVSASAADRIRVRAVLKKGKKGSWSKAAYRTPLRISSVTVFAPSEYYGRVAWARQEGAVQYQIDAGGTTTTIREPSAAVFLLYGETVRVRAKGKGGFGPWSLPVAKGLSAAERGSLEDDLVWYRQQLAEVNAELAALDAQKLRLDYALTVAELYDDTLRAAEIRAELAQLAADRSAAVAAHDKYAARIAEITRMLA